MFQKPFSFNGRIRRTEYAISLLIYLIIILLITTLTSESPIAALICYIPLVWFLWAQGAKRCHDLGNSGWFQIIPFYSLWMLFARGNLDINEYDLNPQAIATAEVAKDL